MEYIYKTRSGEEQREHINVDIATISCVILMGKSAKRITIVQEKIIH